MEDRTIGTDILIKNIKHLDKDNVEEIGLLIEEHCNDWATCDGLAGKVLGRMIKNNSETAHLLKHWKTSKNNWKQRASCVAFVNVARFGKFNKLIINICTNCVKNPERFVQLGVGWVLRELSLADLNLVIKFIKKNYNHISREGLRYSIEKMNPELRKELLNYEK